MRVSVCIEHTQLGALLNALSTLSWERCSMHCVHAAGSAAQCMEHTQPEAHDRPSRVQTAGTNSCSHLASKRRQHSRWKQLTQAAHVRRSGRSGTIVEQFWLRCTVSCFLWTHGSDAAARIPSILLDGTSLDSKQHLRMTELDEQQLQWNRTSYWIRVLEWDHLRELA
jgi:hypothetical protein